MTEKQFSKMFDLWKECEKQGISRNKMFHMSEIIRSSYDPDRIIELYRNALGGKMLPFMTGVPQKISLYSDDSCFRPCPASGEEIAQRLTVTSDGKVYITHYDDDGIVISKEYRRINADHATDWICKLCSHLSVAIDDERYLDVGRWNLDITDIKDKHYHFSGDLIGGYDKWLDAYSEDMRRILDMPNLYVFNCDCSEKVILCSCEFSYGGKQYYYRTDDKTIKIGDAVEVPVGEHGRTEVVRVVDMETVTEDDLPYEYGKIKSIIGMAKPDRMEEQEEIGNDSFPLTEREQNIFRIVKKYIDCLDCEELLEIGAPLDEYDTESRTIAEKLRPTMDKYKIASVIADVMTSAFCCPYESSFFLETALEIKAEYDELLREKNDGS